MITASDIKDILPEQKNRGGLLLLDFHQDLHDFSFLFVVEDGCQNFNSIFFPYSAYFHKILQAPSIHRADEKES
jgi:hypothetical protein